MFYVQKAKIAQAVDNDESLSSSEEAVQPRKGVAATKKKMPPVVGSYSDDGSEDNQPSAAVVKKAVAAKAGAAGKSISANSRSLAQDSSDSSSAEREIRKLQCGITPTSISASCL